MPTTVTSLEESHVCVQGRMWEDVDERCGRPERQSQRVGKVAAEGERIF